MRHAARALPDPAPFPAPRWRAALNTDQDGGLVALN